MLVGLLEALGLLLVSRFIVFNFVFYIFPLSLSLPSQDGYCQSYKLQCAKGQRRQRAACPRGYWTPKHQNINDIILSYYNIKISCYNLLHNNPWCKYYQNINDHHQLEDDDGDEESYLVPSLLTDQLDIDDAVRPYDLVG